MTQTQLCASECDSNYVWVANVLVTNDSLLMIIIIVCILKIQLIQLMHTSAPNPKAQHSQTKFHPHWKVVAKMELKPQINTSQLCYRSACAFECCSSTWDIAAIILHVAFSEGLVVCCVVMWFFCQDLSNTYVQKHNRPSTFLRPWQTHCAGLACGSATSFWYTFTDTCSMKHYMFTR